MTRVVVLGALCSLVLFATPAQAQAPNTDGVSKLRITETSPSHVSLSWDSVENALSYTVSRKNSGGQWEDVTMTTQTSYRDTSVSPGTTYNYRLTVVMQDRLSSQATTPPTPEGGGDEALAVTSVDASSHDGNVPANAVDESRRTRWSAEGDGEWIRLDLGDTKKITGLDIAWFRGDMRKAIFDVEVSHDGDYWRSLRSDVRSAGDTAKQERFDVPDAKGRYVRIVGHGNTAESRWMNGWNSITELRVLGEDVPDEEPVDDHNTAPNAAFSVRPDEGTAPLTVSLDASDSSDEDGSIRSYEWSFGTDLAGSGRTTSYTYDQPGTYNLRLTVTDDDGATDSETRAVTVRQDDADGGDDNGNGGGSCSDGIDNDGDGLTDWQYDLGCVGPDDEEVAQSRANENGWSTVDPAGDTRVIYVSSSEGDDGNSGRSPDTPVRTLAEGYDKLRHGKPDWLLLKRGDTWNEGIERWMKGGRTSQERMVISAYGDGARPVVRRGIEVHSGTGDRPVVRHLAMLGVAFVADPDDRPDKHLFWRGIGGDLLIEGSRFEYGTGNIVMIRRGGDEMINDVTIRRNVVANAFHESEGYSQGLFAGGVNGMTIEENIFDNNGWKNAHMNGGANVTGEASVFNHNNYLVNIDNLTIRNNIYASAAGLGVKLAADEGKRSEHVTVEDNLFVGNGYGLSLKSNNFGPYIHEDITIRNNVFDRLGNTYSDGDSKGNGIVALSTRDVTIRGNYLLRKAVEGGQAIVIDSKPQDNLVIENNVVHDWPIHNPDKLIWIQDSEYHHEITARGNHENRSPDVYADPSRSAARYNATLGGENDLQAFLSEAREQRKGFWRDEYTAEPVVDYIAGGFETTGGDSERDNAAPRAVFSASPTSGTAPLSVSLDASNSSDSDGSIRSYEWTFEDGGSDSGREASRQFSAGTHRVTLTVTDDDGATDTTSRTVRVNAAVSGGGDDDDAGGGASRDGLVAHWTFDGATTDRVGGSDGTSSGNPTVVNGRHDGAFSFDGVDDIVRVDHAAGVDIGGEQITVAAWIKPWSPGQRHESYIATKSEGDDASLYGLKFSPDRRVTGAVQTDGHEYEPTGERQLSLGEWHHVAMTYDGSKLTIYVDGEQDRSVEVSGSIDTRETHFAIGAQADEPGGRRFEGAIDDVRVYDRALSGNEISDLAS